MAVVQLDCSRIRRIIRDLEEIAQTEGNVAARRGSGGSWQDRDAFPQYEGNESALWFCVVTQPEEVERMRPSNRRWAALVLLCMAMLMARGANAANSVRKFTQLVPKNPGAQAMIAARTDAAKKLLAGKKGDWRKDPNFLKAINAKPGTNPSAALSGNTNSAQAGRNRGSLLSNIQSGDFARSFASGHASTSAAPRAASTTASTSFGGFLDAPSYQAIQYPLNGNATSWALNTATADLNNDGYPDVITVDALGNLNVLLNDGKGGFQAPVINTGAQQYMVTQSFGTTSQNWNPPVWITTGDVNGDGLLDIVVTVWGDYWAQMTDGPEIFVYLNQGGGKFSNPTVVNPILGPTEQLSAIVVTDRDGDGKADIVAVSYTEIDHTDSNGYLASVDTNIAVQTLYSNGDGTFKNYGNISHYTYTGYSVIIPNGGAQFVTMGGTRYLALEGQVYDINYFEVGASVLFFQDSNGGRSSQPVANAPSMEVDIGSQYPFALTYANGLSLADLNGDGIPDITLSFGDGYIYTALGTSSGGFATPQVADAGIVPFLPAGWALVDVNGDGVPDMIDMETYYTGIWLGNGDGTFSDPKSFYSSQVNNSVYPGSYPGNNLVAADFDRDGNMDFAETDSTSEIWYGRTSVFKGRGDGTFLAAPALGPPNANPIPEYMGFPWVLDLNGDGLSDIVAKNVYTYALVSGISDGRGNFTYNSDALPWGENGFATADIVAVGDFNGDGFQDLLLAGNQAGNTYTYNGNSYYVYSFAVATSKGDGTFNNPVPVSDGAVSFLNYPGEVLVKDINHDGILDIVLIYGGDQVGGFGQPPQTVNPSGVWVALGNGDGTFQTPAYYPFGKYLAYGGLADGNASGYADLVVYDVGTQTVSVIPGSASGAFSTQNATTLESGLMLYRIQTADVNKDGKADIVIPNAGSADGSIPSDVQIYLNNGDGTFTLTSTPELGENAADVDLVVADFNGDGCADLFTSEWLAIDSTPTYYSGHLSLGNCDGTFQTPQSLLMPPDAQALSIGKFTPDGVPSIVGWSPAGPDFILFNQAGSNVSLTSSGTTITQGNSVSFTADVAPTWPGRPLPTGNISFYDNGTLLGSQAVVSGATTFSTNTLAAGSHAITVSYSGDENYNPRNNSAQANVTVTAAPPVQPEIFISAPASTMTLKQGGAQALTLTLSGNSSYTGSVKLSVSGATGGLNVTLNPSTVSLTNGGSATVQVLVSTTPATTTAMARPISRWLGMTLGVTGFGMFFLGLRRRRALWASLLILLCVMGLWMLSGCGGSGSGTHYAQNGTSTLVVTATPSVSGASVQTATIAVTVQ